MRGFPVAVAVCVLWGDMDAFAHVNNARYFTWFEAARLEYFRAIGLATDGQPDVGPILAHTSCDFIAPVRWPADLVVGATVTKIGNTSLVMQYAAAHANAPDEFVAKGTGVIVLIDYASGEKVRVPDAMRAAIEALAPS